ncbi:MAG: Zn-dependent oligopeptidase [Simkaniaceae bacterium]|nr:Zn-dependent oligopeptidase [Simkaniaceae bacterium]
MRLQKFSAVIVFCLGIQILSANSAKVSPIDTYRMKKQSDIYKILPTKKEQLEARIALAKANFRESIEQIANIENEDRTFENTILAYDKALGLLTIEKNICEVLSLVAMKEAVREAARQGYIEIDTTIGDVLSNASSLYDGILFLEKKEDKIPLERRYFVSQMHKELKHQGLGLSEKRREKVRLIRQELLNLSSMFEKNIQMDESHIWAYRQELYGLPLEFIQSLETKDQLYKLPCDYATYFSVMKFCKSSNIRKKYLSAFENRAYPQNENILEALIFKRDELAKELGYQSFAELDLSKQMVKTEANAHQFIDDLLKKCSLIADQEFGRFSKDLPDDIYLTDNMKMHSYDWSYVLNHYLKKHFQIDEIQVAEYFPLEHTIEQLIKIFESFFSLKITCEKDHLWDSDVTVLAVKSAKNNDLLGYCIFDLFYRPGKEAHPCCAEMIPSYQIDSGDHLVSLQVVISNLSQPSLSRPSLMTHRDVVTLFHEFGHALHGILGSTHLMTACGTHVQTDFVELPSQLLEEWMYDPEIIRMISSHYQTGKPISDEMLQNLIQSHSIGEGIFYLRQCYLAKLSLEFFKEGAIKNTNMIEHKLQEQIMRHFERPDDLHFHNAFGHLDQYGPKYYSYLWSKIYAVDIFNEMKKEGLLNPKTGERYIREILSKGGTEDPNIMLERYLNRKPSIEPFLARIKGAQ